MKRCSTHRSTGNCKLKQYKDTIIRLLGWQKSGTLTIANAGEHTEPQEFLHTAGRSAKWQSHFEDRLTVSYKTEHTLIIPSSNCALHYLPKGVENLCPHKNLQQTNTAAFFITVKTGKQQRRPSVSKRVNNLWYVQARGQYSVLKRHELPIHGRHGGTLNAYY